jgi:hypothetical protein
MEDTQALMSPLGIEFLIMFGTIKEQSILKDIRKLLYFYKSRDAIVPETKKSIFYQLMYKTIVTIYQSTEDKLLRILDQSKS